MENISKITFHMRNGKSFSVTTSEPTKLDLTDYSRAFNKEFPIHQMEHIRVENLIIRGEQIDAISFDFGFPPPQVT